MGTNDILDIDITTNPSVGDIDTNEDIATSDDESKIVTEDTTPTEQIDKKPSNKSNFKKLAKANKEKDKLIAELTARLSAHDGEDDDMEDDDMEDDDMEDDDMEDDDMEDDKITYEKVDLLEFITDTDGASTYKTAIKEALSEFPGISFEKAYQFAKAQDSESTSHSNFSFKNRAVTKTKKLNELTPDEVANANLSPEQFDAWSNSPQKSVNPF